MHLGLATFCLVWRFHHALPQHRFTLNLIPSWICRAHSRLAQARLFLLFHAHPMENRRNKSLQPTAPRAAVAEIGVVKRSSRVPMNENQTVSKQRSLGLAFMLLICFAVLAALLPRQSPATPFSAFMPTELWVVSREEIPAARIWVYSIFTGYVALGTIGWLRGSRLLCWAVPILIVASSLLALARFTFGMRAFTQ